MGKNALQNPSIWAVLRRHNPRVIVLESKKRGMRSSAQRPIKPSSRSYNRRRFIDYRNLTAHTYSPDHRCKFSDSGLVT